MPNNKIKKLCTEKFATFNEETEKYTCIIETCKKELSASTLCYISNLKRHYRLVHNCIIDGAETRPITNGEKYPTKYKIIRGKYIFGSDRKKNKLQERFSFAKFATFNEETQKFTCLIETCKKEISGSNANLKRHYQLVHNRDIDGKSRPKSFEKNYAATKTLNMHKIVIDGVELMPKATENQNIPFELNTTLNREDFFKCCIGLVSKNNLPLRIFDDNDFFKKLIEPYEKKFETTLNSKKVTNVLGDSSQQIQGAIAKIIENKMICLKIDVASWQNKHILAVNIQYIRDFKICINTIGMIQLNKKHTAQYLKEELMKCLEEYNIDIKQIYSITTDNGANAVNVSKLLQELHNENLTMAVEDEVSHLNTYDTIESLLSSAFSVVRCAAQTIQLAAYDVIESLEADLKDVRDIVKSIQTIVKTENQDIKLPCLDNAFRWKSTYDMIVSILDLKDYINNFAIISVNWIFVESFAIAFKPLAESTRHMQKDQYILGDFFRDWLKCELDLEDMIQTNSYAKALHRVMGIKKRKLLENDAFVAALYLDPRFNFQGTPLLTMDQKQTAMDHLIKTYEMINQISSSQSENDNIYSEHSSSSNDIYSKLTQHVNQLVNTSNLTAANRIHHTKTELLAMCEKQIEPFETDVLEYWKKYCQRNSNLSQLAEVVLAVPATQVSVERSFSALDTVLTKSRSKLSKKSLSNIIITKLNFELLDCSGFKKESSEYVEVFDEEVSDEDRVDEIKDEFEYEEFYVEDPLL